MRSGGTRSLNAATSVPLAASGWGDCSVAVQKKRDCEFVRGKKRFLNAATSVPLAASGWGDCSVVVQGIGTYAALSRAIYIRRI
jgi:hypothetical protein